MTAAWKAAECGVFSGAGFQELLATAVQRYKSPEPEAERHAADPHGYRDRLMMMDGDGRWLPRSGRGPGAAAAAPGLRSARPVPVVRCSATVELCAPRRWRAVQPTARSNRAATPPYKAKSQRPRFPSLRGTRRLTRAG